MRRRLFLLFALVGEMLLALSGVVLAQTTTPSTQQSAQAPAHGKLPPPGQAARSCPGPAGRDTADCHALVRTDVQQNDNGGGTTAEETTGLSTTQSNNKGETNAGKNKPTSNVTNPAGYHPADLQAAYNVAKEAASNGGATVAIVDAYNDPNAESDLGVYRSTFGLPACITSNGCFKKVNQNGVAGSYPKNNGGWAQEISLDLDMVSAICPNCNILLVEANSNSFSNLLAAEDIAASLGASVISNSWGGSEFSSETSSNYDGHFNKSIPITVSSGDNGYGVEYPAASQFVTAVGGTSLNKGSCDSTTEPSCRTDSSGTSWAEKVWSGAGSGCSAYEPAQEWQTKLGLSGCSQRMVADVGAVADPNTGVAVYDSYSYQGMKGWLVFGGTSVASPIIGSVYALAGNYSSINDGSYPYNNTPSLYDVISGKNGKCGTYLCTGETGYDGPTGSGTPSGTGGF